MSRKLEMAGRHAGLQREVELAQRRRRRQSRIATWNETDPARRRAIIAETFADDASYVDPLMAGDGHSGIDAMIAGAQQQFPGHRFELTMGPDAHNDRVRFAWSLIGANGGGPVAAGVDFATVAGDGRLRDVTGFLEPAA